MLFVDMVNTRLCCLQTQCCQALLLCTCVGCRHGEHKALLFCRHSEHSAVGCYCCVAVMFGHIAYFIGGVKSDFLFG